MGNPSDHTETPACDSHEASPLAIAFTGHRPNKGIYGFDEHARWQELAECIATALQKLATARGCHIKVITGGAQGVDQVAFWAAEHLRGGVLDENVVYVPYPGQDSPWKPNGDFGRGRYRQMLERADGVVMCIDTPPAPGWAGRLLQMRNVRMIEDSDILLAVTSMDMESMPERGSGTANAIRSAMKMGHPIMRIDPYNPEAGLMPLWSAPDETDRKGSHRKPQDILF